MYTKAELKQQLQNAGLTGKETILIHSSMKAIGEVESGADTVLDAWMEYFADGLLLLPTHTWANVNAEHPVYDYRSTPSCVGLLTNLFRLRAGVVRSLHPTHSLAGFGKGAAEYLAGEDENNTPCTPGGAYDRLKDCGGKILLVGVGRRTQYLHPQRRRSAECTEPAGGGAYGASDDPAGRKQKESIYAETLQCDAASYFRGICEIKPGISGLRSRGRSGIWRREVSPV